MVFSRGAQLKTVEITKHSMGYIVRSVSGRKTVRIFRIFQLFQLFRCKFMGHLTSIVLIYIYIMLLLLLIMVVLEAVLLYYYWNYWL